MSAVDPFVITAKERLKYHDQFNSLNPVNGIVTGAQAKGFLLQSQLPPLILGQIWALADTDADGKMNVNEFSIACKLINLKLRGFEIPKVLPPTLLASLAAVGGTPTRTPTTGMSPSGSIAAIHGAIPPPVPPQPQIMNQQYATVSGVIAHPPGRPVMPPQPVIPSQPLIQAGQPITTTAHVPPVVPSPPNILQQQTQMQTAPMIATVPSQMVMPNQQMVGQIVQQPVMVQQQAAYAMPTQAPAMINTVPNSLPGVVQSSQQIPMQAVAPQPALIHQDSQSMLLQQNIPVQSVAPIPASVVPTNIPALPTPPSGTQSRSMSISERAPSIESPVSANGQTIEWAIKGPAKLKYTQLFNTTDRTRSGFLTGAQARGILMQSKLPQLTLAQIWALSDMDSDGRLGCEEFILAMYLCDLALQGEKIPTTLPPDLVPPSFRKAQSRHGSIAGSRHGSVSSQGASVAVSESDMGLPQNSFEDKRKENFDKGQAELDRRRKLIEDAQRKELEERQRKEREEAEKREKARLEAELKAQQERERELQRQRELEEEREEQRKRELEKKEAARREMEKQRQTEWENQKLSEMELQREKEQEKVLKLKAQNQSLTIELGTLNDKVKDVTQKICDTRAGVTKVKALIDGMRTTRDTQMSEMAQLKARIKEQNQRLIQLSQEKAKLDAKSKATQANDAANQEQIQAAFSNKQILIKQLKDKLEDIREQINTKQSDIDSNKEQLTELKKELSELITACETLYNEYDVERIQILELKHNRKNESITSSWDTGNSWGTSTTIQPSATANTATTVPTSHEAPGDYVKYRAVYEFVARNQDEISFQPGDIVMVSLTQNAEPGWLAGEINGHTGWFPETYVEKVEDETVSYDQQTYNDNNAEIAETIEPVENTTTAYNGDLDYYVAVYSYQSTEPGDLVFNEGDTIIVTSKNGDWWTGTLGENSGMFPSNYVQKLETTSGTVTVNNDYNSTSAVSQNTNDQQVMNHDNEQQSLQQQQLEAAAQELQNQTDVDSEVSQINTQPKVSESSTDYVRPQSRSTSSASQRSGRLKGEVAQAIATYEATSSEQLSLAKGQLVMIRKKTDSGWWEGELQAKGRRRQVGWFPATYVKLMQSGRISGRTTPVSSGKIEYSEVIIDKVIALYPYKAINDDELSFEKDDIISVLGKDEPEWWRGELNGIVGLFPSNYVGPFASGKKNSLRN
ncbi:intersectin-2 [Culicoides brevitarsis]|uniref:intersectin-2 n=1 Tax=Culicoides brevitarsis TaxID=469753 RepID=UPI00307C676E